MTAIEAKISDDSEFLYIHCLFQKELFSLYALLKVTIDQSDLHIERVSMFGFPIYASKIVSDPDNTMIVAYDHESVYANGNAVEDYYLAGSSETTSEIILMGADTEGLDAAQVVSFTTADVQTLYRVEDV